MGLFGKKNVRVFNGKPFIAAYSHIPFSEEKNSASYPDYRFMKIDGRYWCVRVGDFSIPWGFSEREVGFSANGNFLMKRANVSPSSFDSQGFSYKRSGDVFYLYESETDENGFFYGFSVDIKALIMPLFKEYAKKFTKEEFTQNAKGFTELDSVKSILDKYYLMATSVQVNQTR